MTTAKKIVMIDIPTYLLNTEDINSYTKDILAREVKKYFDNNNMFKGININFGNSVSRVGDITRLALWIDKETYNYLKMMKEYTLLSMKKIAEIIVIEKLLVLQSVEG